MKKFKLYIGADNQTGLRTDKQLLKQVLGVRYPEVTGYTLYNSLGVFKGENVIYDEKTTILEIITDYLNLQELLIYYCIIEFL